MRCTKVSLNAFALSLFALTLLTLPPKAFAACASPAGVEGEVLYNASFKLMQFCDGTNWIGMSGTVGTTTDTRLGTLAASKWCAVNAGGTVVNCDQNPPSAGAGTTGRIAKFTGATAVGDSVMTEDSGNIGIGTSPVDKLDVVGRIRAGGTSKALIMDDGTNAIYTSVASTSGVRLVVDQEATKGIAIDTGGRVGIGTTSPSASALLDLSSTGKGFLPPRMTTAQRDAIASPAQGLAVYNNDKGTTDIFTTASGFGAAHWEQNGGNLRALGRGTSGSYNTIVQDTPGGIWWMDGPGSTNGPTGTNSGVLMHLDPLYYTASTKNKYAVQFATVGNGSGSLYFREQLNGAWSAWVPVAGGSTGTSNPNPTIAFSGGGTQTVTLTDNMALYQNNTHDAWSNYGTLPSYLVGAKGTDTVNGTPDGTAVAMAITGGPALCYMLRHSGWAAVADMTGWALKGTGGVEFTTFSPGIDRIYQKVFVPGNYQLDSYSAMYACNTSAVGGGAPGGGTGSIQFNNAGAFSGDTSLFWDNVNKRLGVGTTSPLSLLHINGSNGAENFIRLHDGNSSYGTALGLGTNGDFVVSRYHGAAAQEALRIQRSTGNVGIGTTSPNRMVHIKSSDNWMKFEHTGGRSFLIGTGNTDLFKIYDETADATRVTIDSSGNVGIGTANPIYKLDVAGPISSNDALIANDARIGPNGYMIFLRNISGTNRLDSYNNPITATVPLAFNALNYEFQIADVTKMTIGGSGNVGIGTTSPLSLLHINGSNGAENFIRLHDGNSSYGTALGLGTNGDFVVSRYHGAAAQEALRIQRSTGNVGIGTASPAKQLHIVGAGGGQVAGMRVEDPNTGAGGFAHITLRDRGPASADDEIWDMRVSDTGKLIIGTLNDAETAFPSLVTFQRDGYVGIGTTTPQSPLHVNGGLTVANTCHPAFQSSALNIDYCAAAGGARLAAYTTGGVATNLSLNPYGGNVGIGTVAPKGNAGSTLDIGTGAAVSALGLGGDGSYIGLNTHFTGSWKYKGNGYAATLRLSTGGLDFYTAANNASGADAAMTNNFGMRLDSTGRLGIGTTSPGAPLEVSSPTDTNIRVTSSGAGGRVWGLQSSQSGGLAGVFQIVDWTAAAARLAINTSGNVGIGTTSPAARLDIAGDAKIGNSSATCSATTEGSQRYNATSKRMEFCNGAVWGPIGRGTEPSFYVHKNGTTQTVASGSDVKLTWGTEVFDSNNNFASDRFTPTEAGKYLIILNARCDGATINCGGAIYKTGALYARGTYYGTTGTVRASVIAIVDMNGSTDYVEGFGMNNGGTQISGIATETYFMGSMISR